MRAGEEVQDRRRPSSGGGIVCAGNFIVDRVHTLSYWPRQGNLAHITHQEMGVGGGAANVVMDLASLGFPGALTATGAVGHDGDGDFVAETLGQHGIDVSALQRLQHHATAHTHVMNVPGQSRTFFYHGGANDQLTDSAIDAAGFAQQGYKIFYLGYLMLLPALDRIGEDGMTGAAHLLKAARAAGLLTCVDFVSSEDPAFAEQVAASLPHCDYLIINEMEAGRATNIAVRDETGSLLTGAVEEAGEKLLTGGVAKGVVIHAPELSLWCSPNRAPIITPACPVSPDAIVSTVGAGDAFCAAVLYGLHEGWPVETISAVAHRAAAHCLSGPTATDGIPDMAVLLNEIEERAMASG